MKRFIFMVFSLFLMLSCTDREVKETRLLVKSLVAGEANHIVDTVLVSNQAVTDWIERAGLDSCILGDLIMNNKLELGLFKSENFESDFLSESDYEKLCRESVVDFRFSQKHVPEDVSIVPYEYIQGLLEKFRVDGQTPEIGVIAWYSFSRPVFFQSYKYAFVYYERFTISAPMIDGGTSLLFFEKCDDGEWKLILSQMLMMT
ncbi:hypothetical protein [Cecembia calidifontis]|nr:hypothetical protein [Cecembia calidifontis]